MKLRVLPDAKFSCSCCARCCRGWHVELIAGEAEAIEKLNWPAGYPIQNSPKMYQHAGKTYLPHEADGACVFLNRESGLCRIHEQFGMEAKPLGCQLYPFRIVPTFRGEASVTYRFDCPRVRENFGQPMSEQMPELKRFTQRLALPEHFDASAMGGFTPEQVEAICEYIGTLLGAFERNDQRAIFIVAVCDWLKQTPKEQIDRPALARQFQDLRKQVESSAATPAARVGLMHRLAFRTLLGLYLRRDEDILNGHASRLGRLVAMLKLVIGFGSFSALGISHPKGSVGRAKLFHLAVAPPTAAIAELHWRMIRSKLESFQFMGSANPGRNFLMGLRSLALLYPLVLAAAKYRAGNRGSAAVDAGDIDYAVGAIEHSFGRGAMLRLPFATSLETFLLEPSGFARLVQSV